MLIVCTEIYRRRWDGEEEPGRGNGVRSEANLIRNYFNEAGSESSKFVPILFAASTEAHIPGELKGLGRLTGSKSRRSYDQLYWLLTGQHDTPAPPVGQRRVRPSRAATGLACVRRAPPLPRQPRRGPARFGPASARRRSVCRARRGPGAARSAALPERRNAAAGGRFRDGRGRQILPCRSVLLGPPGQIPRRISAAVARSREAGSGFRADRATGRSAETAGRRRRGAEDAAARPCRALSISKTRIRRKPAALLPSWRPACPDARSSSARDFAGWALAPVGSRSNSRPFDETTALEQLAAELGADAPGQRDWPALVAALGFLPLALHLAAGYLWEGDSAAAFLDRLRRRGLLAGACQSGRSDLSSSAAGR